MSGPTEKHRDEAERLIRESWKTGRAVDGIAAALAKSEREGMKRAAEIATEHAGKNGPVSEFDNDGYWRETTALTIAAAILSECGEGE